MGRVYSHKWPIGSFGKAFFTQIDFLLLILVVIFAGIGLLILYSAADGATARFDAQIKNWGLALVVMFLAAQMKPTYLKNMTVPIFLLSVILLLGVELFGETRKGATRWLNLGVVTIQPSELMKFAMPMMLAWWFHQRQQFNVMTNFVVAVVFLLIPVSLILLQPDLGTALLVLFSGVVVIFFAGLSWKLIIPPVLLFLIFLVLLLVNQDTWCSSGQEWYFLHDYQVKRVCTLLNPEADSLGGGYHILHSTTAIGSGGMTGKGFMQGTQAHLYFIPESTTDFIFAVYAEEFGLLGNGLLLLAYLCLIWKGLHIAGKAVTEFSRLLACGITLNFFICVFVNLGMVSGILPVVGVPLPFVSYGGTALLSFCTSIGILMSIAAETKLEENSQKKHFY
ncbi:MAG: rod shape-determining protein RodA [Saezia sp.]